MASIALGQADVILSARAAGDDAQQGVVAAGILPLQLGHFHLDTPGQSLATRFRHGQFEAIRAFLQGGELPQIGARPGRDRPASRRLAAEPSGWIICRLTLGASSGSSRALVSCARTSTRVAQACSDPGRPATRRGWSRAAAGPAKRGGSAWCRTARNRLRRPSGAATFRRCPGKTRCRSRRTARQSRPAAGRLSAVRGSEKRAKTVAPGFGPRIGTVAVDAGKLGPGLPRLAVAVSPSQRKSASCPSRVKPSGHGSLLA